MAFDPLMEEYITAQLSEFGDFNTRKMFGGLRYFRKGIMFGAIMHGAFRLRGDESSESDFAKYGKGRHKIPGKKMSMPYYEVPDEILEDVLLLADWSSKAYKIAVLNSKKKKK